MKLHVCVTLPTVVSSLHWGYGAPALRLKQLDAAQNQMKLQFQWSLLHRSLLEFARYVYKSTKCKMSSTNGELSAPSFAHLPVSHRLIISNPLSTPAGGEHAAFIKMSSQPHLSVCIFNFRLDTHSCTRRMYNCTEISIDKTQTHSNVYTNATVIPV